MPIIQQKKLILVEAKEINFQGRNGEAVKKWKYTFLGPDEKLSVAYDDYGVYGKRVKSVNGWDPIQAENFTFVLREFQGQTKLQLMSGAQVKDKAK